MALIVALIMILIQGLAVYCQQITLPPENATVAKGEWVQLKCEVDSMFVAWIYLPRIGESQKIFNSLEPESYDKDVYEMEIDQMPTNKKYYLAVKSPVWQNGGTYTCMELLSLTQASANLVVVEPPTLTLPTIKEGRGIKLICEADFGGPELVNLADSQIPKILLDINGEIFSSGTGIFTQPNPDTPCQVYIHLKFHYVSIEDDGKDMTCVIKTFQPAFEISDSQKIKFAATEEEESMVEPESGPFSKGLSAHAKLKLLRWLQSDEDRRENSIFKKDTGHQQFQEYSGNQHCKKSGRNLKSEGPEEDQDPQVDCD